MTPPEIELVDPTSNPHGRVLVQQGNVLKVLSGCCRAEINPEMYNEALHQTMCVCTNCETELQVNDRGWLSILENAAGYSGDRPSSWAPWGKFWFGFEEFAMEVTL